MRTHSITPHEHARVTAAIQEAETATDGEIYCVVAHSSEGYFYPAAFTATIAMFIASLVAAFGLEQFWLAVRLPHFVAAQVLANGRALADSGWDWGKVNVNGGAIALGDPLGATGARLLTSLVHALKARDLQRGIATLCLGGGEAVALAVERLN